MTASAVIDCALLSQSAEGSDFPRVSCAIYLRGMKRLAALLFFVFCSALCFTSPLAAQSTTEIANPCATNPPIADLSATPSWNGWGADNSNSRFQPQGAAQITAADV